MSVVQHFRCGCLVVDGKVTRTCKRARRWESRWRNLFNEEGWLKDLKAAQELGEHYDNPLETITTTEKEKG